MLNHEGCGVDGDSTCTKITPSSQQSWFSRTFPDLFGRMHRMVVMRRSTTMSGCSGLKERWHAMAEDGMRRSVNPRSNFSRISEASSRHSSDVSFVGFCIFGISGGPPVYCRLGPLSIYIYISTQTYHFLNQQ